MKKLYSAPLMEIEKFDVEDVITTSVIKQTDDSSATNPKYTVEIVSKW